VLSLWGQIPPGASGTVQLEHSTQLICWVASAAAAASSARPGGNTTSHRFTAENSSMLDLVRFAPVSLTHPLLFSPQIQEGETPVVLKTVRATAAPRQARESTRTKAWS
jgi:hypothetical protein